ncbi:hypothetical protein RUM44_008117 [Polyplax serrata]|uniref:Uncharacterized protein n=1 Tax=Polyplax serrata TaxID=468196 RepID=A0ABR1B9F9_POLSC
MSKKTKLAQDFDEEVSWNGGLEKLVEAHLQEKGIPSPQGNKHKLLEQTYSLDESLKLSVRPDLVH